MRCKKWIKNSAGFTLTELLVVIVIVGILAGLVIPKYAKHTTRAKETEAKLMLKEVYNLQKAYYLENDVWGATLEEIGFEQAKLKTEGGNARYEIELESVTNEGFKAIATSVIDFDKDKIFNVWSIDHENNLLRDEAD